jgi:hypothetical protein
MQEFNATLIREKITLTGGEDARPVILRSNRLHLALGDRVTTEDIVIRAHSMHVALRLAARVFYSYHKNGFFNRRAEPFDWAAAWDLLLTTHDRKHHPAVWAAVYINSKPVFKTTDESVIDIVEQCALRDPGDYDAAIASTVRALEKSGQQARIEQAAKVGAVFTDDGRTLRCGINYRADGRNATFNFMTAKGELFSRVPQGFNIAGAFLEAIDIRHYLRVTFKRLQSGEVAKNAPEMARYYAAPARLRDLRKALSSFEEHFEVKYRPEKPDVFAPPRDVVI